MFRLLSAGHHFAHPAGFRVNRPKGAGNYAFVLFLSEGRMWAAGKELAVPAGSYILFRPDTPQHYGSGEDAFVNDWFHCEGNGLADFLDRMAFPMDTILPAADLTELSHGVRALCDALIQKGPYWEELADCELRGLLYRLARDQAAEPAGRDGRYDRQLLSLRTRIYHEPGKYRRVEELAAEINLSVSHFHHIYRGLFGVSVMEDIIESRITCAKYLLGSGSLSVAQVALLCGYENDVHFIRQFKKRTGVTPGKYRG